MDLKNKKVQSCSHGEIWYTNRSETWKERECIDGDEVMKELFSWPGILQSCMPS